MLVDLHICQNVLGGGQGKESLVWKKTRIVWPYFNPPSHILVKTKCMDSADLGKLLRGSERNLSLFLEKKKKV